MTRKVENQFFLNYAIDSLEETKENQNKKDLIMYLAHENWELVEEEFVGHYFENCYKCEDFNFLEIAEKILNAVPEVKGGDQNKNLSFIKSIASAAADFMCNICNAIDIYYQEQV